MSQADDAAGVFDVIDTDASAHTPVNHEEVSAEAKAEGSESTAETKPEPKTNTQPAPEATSTETKPAEGTQPAVPAQGETQTEANTEAEQPSQVKNDAATENWQENLPLPPKPYDGPKPVVDEQGQITNMTAEQYATYMSESTMAKIRMELYENQFENAALDAAEKILPEIRTNPAIRMLVQNARVASVINGRPVDPYTAAKQVREALGIAPAKLSEAKAAGAQNAKVSIETQKAAAVETGATRSKPVNDDSTKVTDLQKRIKRGDDEAFIELMDIWEKHGKL